VTRGRLVLTAATPYDFREWSGRAGSVMEEIAMRSIRRSILPAALFTVCFVPLATWAGCNRPIEVPIRFQPGAVCWQHVGAGTTFTGQFGARQRVTAAAIGQSDNADEKHNWTTTGHWQISISGPGGFFVEAMDGQLEAVLPRSGTYTFEIGPCAVWGAPGMIEICTS
jgi:hypothetical protein